MNLKTKILSYIYKKNEKFFQFHVKQSVLEDLYKQSIEELFEQRKELFESLFIKDFIGYIPKEITEPALKIFEEHGEMFQRWVMWQSYYVNRKALHDQQRLQVYDGMMIYLKVIYLMAEANKKKWVPPKRTTTSSEPEIPWLDKALQDVNFFKENHGKTKDKTTEGEAD